MRAALGQNENHLHYIDGQERTNYPFALSVDDFGDDFSLDLQVNHAIDAARMVEYMQAAISQLVTCLQTMPTKPVVELSILSAEETKQQLITWNDTATTYQQDSCIHELFEAQVLTH